MAEAGMKDKVLKGLFWKILESGGAQGIQFVIAILLARLLSPAEYGLVGIITIFIAIANVIVQSGFSTALVQKENTDQADFSSVFYFDLFVAAVLYAVLYLAAPLIAGFYGQEILTPIVRVLAVVLFPGGVISVQTAYVSKKLEFKGLFQATMAAVVASGAVSIFMAYQGYGVWAMAAQQITYYMVLMLVLFIRITWRPSLIFSFRRIRIMFSFGWKLLCAALIDTLYNNLYGLLIGKIYNEELLGSYNRGEQFPKLIVSNLGAAIQAVMLPAFSAAQTDIALVKTMVRRAVMLSSFLVLPMMYGMIAVADTLVLALLGEKWLICVPFLRIMCVAYSFWPIHITNLQAINAVGRSDVFLKLEITKKTIGFIGLFIGIRYNVLTLVALKAVIDFLCTFINAWPNKQLLGYSIGEQWKDILPSMMVSVIMCAVVYSLQFILPGVWFCLAVQILAGAVIYTLLAWLFHMESFVYLRDTLLAKLPGRN